MNRTTLVIAVLIAVLQFESLPVCGWYRWYSRQYYNPWDSRSHGRWETPSRRPYGRWDSPSASPNGGWNNPQRPPYNPWGSSSSSPNGGWNNPQRPPYNPYGSSSTSSNGGWNNPQRPPYNPSHRGQPGGSTVSPPVGPPGGSTVATPVGPPGGSTVSPPVSPPGNPPMSVPVPANTPPSPGAQTSTPGQKTHLDFVFSKGLFGLPWLSGFGVNGKLWTPFLEGKNTSDVNVVSVGI